MNHQSAFDQNARVWARRLDVALTAEQAAKAYNYLTDRGVTSMRQAALIAVMRPWLISHGVPADMTATRLAVVVGKVAHKLCYGQDGNILAELAQAASEQGVEYIKDFTSYSSVACKAVGAAITSRTAERSRPSLGNHIAQKLLRRGK